MSGSKELVGLKRCKEQIPEPHGLKRCKLVGDEDAKTKTKNDNDDDESYRCLFYDYDDSDPDDKMNCKHLDVISLLSNSNNDETETETETRRCLFLVKSSGEPVSLDVVRGKHLIICCVSLPMSDIDCSQQCWLSLLDAYPEFSRAGFELVVAVTTKHNNKPAFDAFLSTLPCLAIPFPHLDTRNSICSFIGLKDRCIHRTVSAIVVDPSGRVLHYRDTLHIFLSYGFEWFTRDVTDIATEDEVLRMRLDPFFKTSDRLTKPIDRDSISTKPLSLHKDILLCDPSRVLSRFNQPGQSLTVSELSNKLVGLYLCFDMRFFSDLREIHEKCIAAKQELEIVLVPLPLFDPPRQLYYGELTRALENEDVKSWFILPYDNKVCRRLWRVFANQEIFDRFVILPPNCKSGELKGRTVLHQLGIEAYPFTRSAILEHRFAALKSLTPASLFKGTCETYTCLIQAGGNSKVPQSAIKGKNLLVYLDGAVVLHDHAELYHLLMEVYPKIQDMGWEVVFVPLHTSEEPPCYFPYRPMPWPQMPYKAAFEASVEAQLFLQYDMDENCFHNKLVAFGGDGEILSTQVKERLKKYGVTASLLRENLRKEIIEDLDSLVFADDMSY